MLASLRLFGNFDLSVEPPHARQSRSELHSALAKSELSMTGSLVVVATALRYQSSSSSFSLTLSASSFVVALSKFSATKRKSSG